MKNSPLIYQKENIMKVKEVMTQIVGVIDPDNSLKEAAIKMGDMSVSALPVYKAGKLIGLVTDTDIVLRGVAKGMDPNSSKVDSVMSKSIKACSDDSHIDEAIKMMKDLQTRRLPVVNSSGGFVGIVSVTDIAKKVDKNIAGGILCETCSR
jgi:predicted transcriptional regulator